LHRTNAHLRWRHAVEYDGFAFALAGKLFLQFFNFGLESHFIRLALHQLRLQPMHLFQRSLLARHRARVAVAEAHLLQVVDA
jgi:hypothetical protein